ncbi:MAG: EAL domain-containing protein, partial [Chromatiaceae bacterium]|nr:EAL domain-containing protein [Chromatiaceae bacterium]
MVGRNPRLLQSGRQSPSFYAALWQSLERNGVWHGEFWNRRKDGELYLALATISAVRDTQGRVSHYVGIATDITGQKEAEQRIEHLAYYDALTELPNRTLLTQRAELALSMATQLDKPLAVLFLDLDRFKEVNDSLGHPEGDALLLQAAARLRALVRDTDTLSRLGGDEFVLLLPGAEESGTLKVAEKILAAFRAPFSLSGHPLGITISIGIAIFPHDGQNVDELLKNADTALHRAKQNGRNQLEFYDRTMNVATFERLMLESELRQAQQGRQLRAFYQPKIRLSDGQLVGAEALVRWQHPKRGLVPPGHFIPVAETSGLIVELGEWMLDEVCAQLAHWRQEGLALISVAVNLGARHFREPDLVDRIRERLARHGLPAHCLELELTESVLLDNAPQIGASLAALEHLGVGLAIDDFGTGYSSLGYLKRLPLTTLKIDRSFVQDLETDPDDRVLAATIVALGHSLELEIVAEGVESEAQRRLLLEQGCDLAQGYLFSPAVPAD